MREVHAVPASLRAACLTLLVAAICPAWAASPVLAIDLVDSPGTAAHAINARGDIVGDFAEWPCDDRQCPPRTSTAVWPARDRSRLILPTLGTLVIVPATLDGQGRVTGTVTDFATTSHAVVWDRVDGSYQLHDLGTLPGFSDAAAAGADASGRVVGYASGGSGWRPFVWTDAGGMVDLGDAGFPLERPASVSPAGWVVSDDHTWSLDDVGSVQPLPPPPGGFYPPAGARMRINDRRELAGFLVATSGQQLVFLHRYRPATGGWQLLSNSPTGHLSSWGVGSMSRDATVVATVTSTAVIADGPDGLAVPLQGRLSPAYPGVSVADGGPANERGAIAALAVIGNAKRLVRLEPIEACRGDCVRVSALSMRGKFIEDPDDPGRCTPKARNKVRASLMVVDALGQPREGVKVRARFLDEYELNETVSGRTDAAGRLELRHEGAACVGAVTLVVESLRAEGSRFDRGKGRLAASVIPLP
jgi:probable HAF family extracellular repeat protein